ncbi:sigma-70 family RNA polymerase sigma factor [Acetobacterium woodii]|uniref:RNA polymerase sigma factor SigS n=1 Tax=Acetobacterium woodii (strain ATCC 29683 / DSM 1030 / JCM 2381 / KCTC 1655 / WB1) TaxID=931626 RepID=H6LGV5_ACEWD|nr:sigma-70 family RNA polymerase sigma factor [Acetobacterium woodii]AFA49619.1 putative RNA polymerase sigma factor [Acetobacterium woodii DSM 1030]
MENKSNEKKLESDLVKRAQSGDKEAEEFLLEKYRKIVLIRARAYYLVGGDNEDLIQEGMIGLLKAIWDFKPDREARFSTFANLCIERQIQTAISSANRQKHMLLNNSVSIYAAVSEEEPHHIIIDRLTAKKSIEPGAELIKEEELEQLMLDVKRELSNFEKKVLSYYIQGASYLEISEALDCSNKSVDNALQRIRKKIGKRL